MNRNNNEKVIVLVTSLASVGLIIENFLMGWEFWVPAVVVLGVISMWVVSLSENIEFETRKTFYFTFAALILFYHGIHKTSFFDTALTVVLVMATYSVFCSIHMMNICLLEYFAILFIHLINLPGGEPIVMDKISVSRVCLHIVIVLLVYFISVRFINIGIESQHQAIIREEQIKANDDSMEDFLSNISHELRTPVNVVNGMSDLLIKRDVGSEAYSIKNAGVRLAYQIEDIQDYTECKRDRVFLEEDNYMSTSLINDVVTSFRLSDNTGDLELVVDLDPAVPAMMRGDIRKLHKIFRHLLENAVKFTRVGGIFVRMYVENTGSGVNLCIEMTDTGIGMDRVALRSVTDGMYQANKKRNRSSGGIGLGLFIVYGFAHRMGGFVRIESEKGVGTMIRVTIPQKVVDPAPCLSLEESFEGAVLFHVRPDKYKIPKVRDFYRSMAAHLAAGIHVPLYSADTVHEVERLREKLSVKYIFMGPEEYEENTEYFDKLAEDGVVVAVSAGADFCVTKGSRVMLMPKPLYAYPVIKILNEGRYASDLEGIGNTERPVFKGVRALIVDDEPMNLVVATSLFRDYEMEIETAGSGREAIRKCHDNDYDLVFMDHMMPEMDGVEAMKQIKSVVSDLGKEITVVALTANAVSGAREMFIREGFDGFIAKPINTADFERVMLRVLPHGATSRGGDKE